MARQKHKDKIIIPRILDIRGVIIKRSDGLVFDTKIKISIAILRICEICVQICSLRVGILSINAVKTLNDCDYRLALTINDL